jgi:predicted outer membrane repeat protein
LRDAVAQANENEGADLIVFSKELTGTIKLAGEQLLVTDTLTIKGPGAGKLAIDGDRRSRIFSVTDFADDTDSKFTVSGLAFHDGLQSTNDKSGGAITSTESLTVKDCVFTSNSSEQSGGAIRIFQPGDPSLPINLDVRSSSFVFNSAELASGGAISASVAGSVTIKNSVFQGNLSSIRGGALSVDLAPGQTALLQGCKFQGNRGSLGGAVSVTGGEGSAVLIRGSVLTDNEALDDGGALSPYAAPHAKLRKSDQDHRLGNFEK